MFGDLSAGCVHKVSAEGLSILGQGFTDVEAAWYTCTHVYNNKGAQAPL